MAAPSVIGGNGYRWRGKSIRTVRRNNATCVTMPRKDSMVMIPVGVAPHSHYKVTIAASKNSGNGALLVNFFCGKNYDGDQISVFVASNQTKDYTISVPVPKFPSNLPVYLRVWRPNDATGNVFITTIRYQLISGKPNIPRSPRPQVIPQPKNRVIRDKNKKVATKTRHKHKPIPPIIARPKEDRTMKFKPYKARGTSMVDKVLIKEPSDVPMVSIITPTRDGVENVKKCYEALDKNTGYPNWEWIVGDSDSKDGTAEYIKSLGDPRIKLVERGTTDGSFSTINNELTKFAKGEYLLFLNDDTQPQEFWLYEMMSKIHRHPEIGIVGAKLLYSKGRIQHAGIAFVPQGPANLGKAVLGSFPKGYAEHDRFYQAVTGACLLIREEDFRAIKGFDPVYYFCYEDVDLCLKVVFNLKKKVLYASNANVIHAESVTQKKHKTAGEKQQAGIKVFKERWMAKVNKDFGAYQKNTAKGRYPVKLSFVTCVNNLTQYRNYIIGSLFNNNTSVNYEVIPIMNFGNPHSAASALNLGIDQAKSDIIVLCHQDVLFYENWVDMLFERIKQIEDRPTVKRWGVLGTAGITKRDCTAGVVHSIKGKLQWQATKRAKVYPVQTVDEHCMIIRKGSKLRFDEKNFDGFHFYGSDLALSALDRGMENYGILCPLAHDSSSGSLISGKREFMRLLNNLARKWRPKFTYIRTPTSVVRKRSVRTFVRFKKK